MWFIYVSLCIGIIIGALNIFPMKILKYNDNFVTIGIFTLLFLMGISIGVNKDVIKNLSKVGLTGLLYALLTVFFSVIIVYIFTRMKNNENDN